MTDNGTQFTSQVFMITWNSVASSTGVHPYTDPGSGNIERFNRTLKFWKLATMNQSNNPFQQHLQLRLARYRSTPHCTTGRTPSELLHGCVVRLQLPVLGQHPTTDPDARGRAERQQQRNRRAYETPRSASKSSALFSPQRVSRQAVPGTFELKNGCDGTPPISLAFRIHSSNEIHISKKVS